MDSDQTTAIIANSCFEKDAEFISASREMVPELARRLKKACDELRSIYGYKKLAAELEAMPEEK